MSEPRNEPADAGTITMHHGQTWIDTEEELNTGSVYVMSVVRGSGPREGAPLGWAVVTVTEDDETEMTLFLTREQAVDEWRRALG